ncbi:MAG: hypothetical protein WD971_11050 [Pirellulales bacterium]
MKCPRISRGRFLCSLTLAVAICCSAIASEEEGVVVLRSGGVLHGKVSVSGERYVVTQPKSVVDVPAPQVLLVANSMDDAYQRQRQQLPHDTTEAHLGLAEWCLRYNLINPAAQELIDARRLDPRDPRVALLERRLAVASQPKRKSPPSQAPARTHDDSPSKEELQKLDALVKELPPGVVERFTRKVQPLLVNNCTTSGCHQAGSQQDFQLDRAVLHGLSNRRITLRNLVATLALVDRDAPQQSDLLSIPRHSHGGMDRPILGPRQESQLTQLVDWVGLVTETSVATEPIAARSDVDTAPIQPLEPLDKIGKPSRFLDRNVAPADFDDTQQPLRPKGEVKFGADLRPRQPRDEFDPEIFNRLKPDPVQPSATTTAVGPPATR